MNQLRYWASSQTDWVDLDLITMHIYLTYFKHEIEYIGPIYNH